MQKCGLHTLIHTFSFENWSLYVDSKIKECLVSGEFLTSRGGFIFEIDGTGFGCGERGGLRKQKFLESFRLSTHERRIKEYGAPGRFGGYPSFGSHLSQTPIHTIQLLKVALRPCTSPPDMCGWTWNICLISITYHIPNLPLSL